MILKVYWYTVSKEESNVLGSGSTTLWSNNYDTESEAFEHLRKDYGNTLTRYVKRKHKSGDIRFESDWYDFIYKCWRDSCNNVVDNEEHAYPNPVEVIYCKDCWHYSEKGYEPDSSGEDYLNSGYCSCHGHDTQRCGYCSFAMKRSDMKTDIKM